MKKSLIFGAALMLVGAFSFQSCANESKPGVPTEAAIDNGTELADVIVSHAKDGVLALPKSVVELNVSADLDLSQVEIQNDSPLILILTICSTVLFLHLLEPGSTNKNR